MSEARGAGRGGPWTAVAKKPHAIAKIAEGSLFIIMILVAEECACGCCWQRARADVVPQPTRLQTWRVAHANTIDDCWNFSLAFRPHLFPPHVHGQSTSPCFRRLTCALSRLRRSS